MAQYHGGFGGGNYQQLMKQAQAMQRKLQEAQEKIAETEVVGSAGGVVEVTMMANKTPVSIKIKPEAVDPEDVEMLEDLVLAAFNDALAKAEKVSSDLMGPLGNTGLF